jgi:formylglycine-generating enzyme required for sulfatase activity
MMSPRDLGRFLSDVDAQVVDVGPRELVRVRRLLESRRDWPRAELRAALSSLLARNPREWKEIAARFDRSVGGEPATPDEGRPVVAPPSAGRALATPRRWRWTSGTRLALVVAVVVCGVGGLVWALDRPDAVDVDDSRSRSMDARPLPLPEPELAETTCRLRAEPAVPATSVVRAGGSPAVERTWGDWVTLGAVSACLFLLGLRWLLLPAFVRGSAVAERKRLIDGAIRRGILLRPTYHLPEVLPMRREVIEDAAALLGRVFRFYPGSDVDVIETIRRTIDEGGRWSPAFRPRRDRSELVIVSDLNDEIWIGFWNSVVTVWQRLGVDIARYRFRSALSSIEPWRAPGRLDLEGLRQRHEGAALIVFSSFAAGLAPLTRGARDWVGELSDWPLVAWVDPDPRSDRERGRLAHRVAGRLDAAGLTRFPFTAPGVASLARWLVAGGVGVAPADREVLAPLADRAVDEGIRRWATAAALVPDASWEQLEEFRRSLAGVARAVPDFRYLQRLWEWVSRRMGPDRPPQPTETLLVPLSLGTDLIRELSPEDRDARDPTGLCGQVHRMLLEQLGPSPDGDDPLQRLRWQLTRDRHRAALEPARAAELFAAYVGTAVEDELSAHVKAGLERGTWEAASELRGMCSKAGVVKLRSLAGHPLRLWARAAALTVLPAVLLASIAVLFEASIDPSQLDGAQTQVLRFPQIEVCERAERRRWVATADRPAMVEILPGRFLMGSSREEPERDEDEVQHDVAITRSFAMSVTEVTQAQYLEVMDQAIVCAEATIGPDLPVVCVDFAEAAEYANRLSAKEGLQPCYERNRADVRWPEPACRGFRLPTEAEWEYAARAGMRWRYAGGDDPGAIAWFSGNSGGKAHPVGTKEANPWGLRDMSGNAWEWVWDRYGPYTAASQRDPRGPATGSHRVYRGGSFDGPTQFLRVAYRFRVLSSERNGRLGFRLARSL